MVLSFIVEFFRNVRLDMVITLVIAIFFYFILIYKRHKKNKELKLKKKKPKEILVAVDLFYTIATASTTYGGISAIYYALTGQLLFNKNLIISQEYMILFSGLVLLALAIMVFKKSLKEIEEGKD